MRFDSRLAKLEDYARTNHRAAWSAFRERVQTALSTVPPKMLEVPFAPGASEGLADLENDLLLWADWVETIAPLLEQAEDDLALWPHDLPLPPGDPTPLILEIVSRWHKHPTRPWGSVVRVLALGAARRGEGVPSRSDDERE